MGWKYTANVMPPDKVELYNRRTKKWVPCDVIRHMIDQDGTSWNEYRTALGKTGVLPSHSSLIRKRFS